MKTLTLFLLGFSLSASADTIDHYIGIANGIPQMEIKADPQSQAWARSARTVLTLTCDGIIDTLMLANESAKQQGKPLFCVAGDARISPEALNDLVQQTYKSMTMPQNEKDKMTVSQVALLALQKQYPCTPQGNAAPPALNTTPPAFQPQAWGAPG